MALFTSIDTFANKLIHMATTGDVSVGIYIRFNNELCQITEWQHRTPGNLRAFYQCKMRNVLNGKNLENRFRSGETVDIVRMEFRDLQYIYQEGDSIVVMDNVTFEQIYLPTSLFGDKINFLKEGMIVKVSFEGDDAISAEPPTFVEMEITYCEPGFKGDTATSSLKPATIETGGTVMVPLFVNNGDKIKIDTRTGEYNDRVK